MSFRVLHVCTGNICRSPIAEHLMRAGLDSRLGGGEHPFVVASAGTWGHEGSPMEDDAHSTLASYGIDGSGFRARELATQDVQDADLVLAATREHRAAAVVLHPRAAAHTFTLLEFARLLTAVDPAELPGGDLEERARAVVRGAASKRGIVRPPTPDDDDLSDPYHAPASAFTLCAQRVQAALVLPMDLLAGRLG